MKISEKWLREWVNPDVSTDQLVEQITMAGLRSMVLRLLLVIFPVSLSVKSLRWNSIPMPINCAFVRLPVVMKLCRWFVVRPMLVPALKFPCDRWR